MHLELKKAKAKVKEHYVRHMDILIYSIYKANGYKQVLSTEKFGIERHVDSANT